MNESTAHETTANQTTANQMTANQATANQTTANESTTRPALSEPDQRSAVAAEWPLYEVFVRAKRGLNHVHVGSLHAADDPMALRHARDVYTRRNEGISIWVVRADAIAASSPAEKDPFFAPSGDKVYRHPTFYEIPADVPHM